MRKNRAMIVMFCALLAAPGMGYWEYDGTSTYVDGPGSDSDPNGTWSWSASASGNLNFGMTYLQASGWASGNASVNLAPYPGFGLSRGAYAYSSVGGSSSYRWIPDGTSKAITVVVYTSINNVMINYDGEAVNRTGTLPTTSSSGASVLGGGGVSYLNYFYASGSGQGSANSEGGSYASNSCSSLSASVDDADANQSSISGWYDGVLWCSGSDSRTYTGTPWSNSVSAPVSVSGSAAAVGQMVINDPEFYWGGFYAYAD
ncbi:MAG TPA: hypothetical protein PKZ07_16200 [Sedimentisphaerales bacterium]|nr:hypothetical protein [Sedimentisphaerales bacterium]